MINFFKDLWTDDWMGRTLLIVVVMLILAIPLFVWWAIAEDRAWAKYAKEHHCVATGESRSYTALMPMLVGKSTILIPQVRTEYEYKCDDGTVHWR